MSNKLTVNYGVRYEYTPPTWKGYYPDGYSNFNPNLPNPGGRRPSGRLGVRRRRARAAPASERCTTPGRGGSARAWASSTSVNEDTVVRLSGSRTFGSVKNTGGSSHWNGFIGGYNVTAPAFPASSAFNWDAGLAGVAGAAVPRAGNAQRQQHPVLAAGRLGAPARVLLVDAQRAAAVARPVHRGGGLQRAARATPHDEPSQPESGRPRDLLRFRPAVRAGRRNQSDELAHGLDAGAPGGHRLSVSVVPRLAVGAAGPAPLSAVPRHQHRRRRRRSQRTIELPRVRAARREAVRGRA